MFSFFNFCKRKNKKIGLALSGGNARGLAHIGVIKALVKHNIPIDFIAGTSLGSLVGGFYAFFGDIQKLEDVANRINYQELISIFFDPFAQNGLVKGDKFTRFLEKHFNGIKIEDLKIPFQSVAVDFATSQPYFFSTGKLSTAIRASSSIPLFFDPVKENGKTLIDGGFSIPVPVDRVREMGADFVIAVNLYNRENFYSEKNKNILNIAEISIDLLFKNLAMENVKNADIVIAPKLQDYSKMDFIKSKSFIDIGEKETEKIISKSNFLKQFL